MNVFPSRYRDRCGTCLLPIRKGELIRRLEIPARIEILERYNYDKQRTEGGGIRSLKYAHARCPNRCPICGQAEPHVCRESL